MTARSVGSVSSPVVTAVLVVAAGVQAVRVHSAGGGWTLVASATPHRFTFRSRDYDRANRRHPDTDLVRRGSTAGGAAVYEPAADVGTPTVIFVRDGRTWWEYTLVGGP